MKNDNLEFTPKSYLKTMSIMHLLFLFALLAFLTATFVLNENYVLDYSDMSDPFIYIVPIFSLGGYFLGNLLFKSNIGKIDKNEPLKNKLAKYQSATIIRFAFVEGPALLGISIFFTTGNMFYIIFAGLLIVYFFTLKPTKDKVIHELKMDQSEKTIFNKENQEIK